MSLGSKKQEIGNQRQVLSGAHTTSEWQYFQRGVALPKYSYTVAGTAVENQTWTVTGEIVTRPLTSFQRAPEKALRDALWKLTRGNAVFGLPGVACKGPYRITKLVIEVVD
jgi:hypothetical protein